MLKRLVTLPRDASVEAAYYLARLLRYKNLLPELTRAQVLSKGLQPPSPEIRQAVNELVKEIETAEGGRIEDLPDSTIEKYTLEILDILQDRSAKEFGYDIQQGKELLQQLRRAEQRR
jgi:hypothetical protein